MVGVAGFEPAALSSQAKYSTKLSYTPILEPSGGFEPSTYALQEHYSTIELWRLTSRHLFLVLPITPQFIRTDRTRTYIFIVNKILRICLLTVSFIVTLNQLLVTHLGLEPRTPWLMVVNVRTALTHILININIFIKIMLFTLIYQVKCSTTELMGHMWCSCRDSNPNGLRQRILSPPCIPVPSQLHILII